MILQHIYGALRPRNDDQPLGELLTFSQREFTLPTSPVSYSLAQSCAALESCRVHIALHRASGDDQNFTAIGMVAGPSFSETPATS